MIQNIGKHRVQCGDIMNGIDNLMQSQQADFVYSDPPWGQGNLRYWQTINKRHTGKEPNEINYAKFLPHYFSLVSKYARDLAVIEYGVAWREDVVKVASDVGFKHMGVFQSLYQASQLLPLDIHVLSKSGGVLIPSNFDDKLLELRGLPLVKYIFEVLCPNDAQIVLDPMCGMGYTAQAAADLGKAFYGNELNQKRLEKTIKRLQKKP
jgi:hypothetical protein